MLKFLHAADIHLDSPLRGLARYEGAPQDEIRGASRRALENLVQLALDEQVDFVLVAGDLFDGDWKDHNTGLFFVAQVARLARQGIAVVMISGNHDAAARMTRSLPLPEHVRLLDHRRPETVVLESCGVAIHGQGFAKAKEFGNLAERYPQASAGLWNVGLLHTSLGRDDGHEPYAPCTIDDLVSKGYEYWALGHIHRREIVREEPLIVFPGNLQGRHIRETGPKGCMLVSVDQRGQPVAEFRPLDVFRWEVCRLEARDARRIDELLERFTTELKELEQQASGLPMAVRAVVVGPAGGAGNALSQADDLLHQFRAAAIDASAGRVWVEKLVWDTPVARQTSAGPTDEGPLDEVATLIQQLRDDRDGLLDLAGSLESLKRKLPPELRQGPDALAIDDADWLAKMLDDVEGLLAAKLASQGGEW